MGSIADLEKTQWIHHFSQYQVFWKLLSDPGPSTINVKRAALMENKCSWVYVFSLIQWKVPMRVGPRPGCSPVGPLQALGPQKRSALVHRLCFPGSWACWPLPGFHLAGDFTARRRKTSVPPSSSLLETFQSARSFSGVAALTTWHWPWCGVTAVTFSHLPRPGGWWCPNVDSLTEARLVPWFSHRLCGQFSMPWSFFFFFLSIYSGLAQIECHIIYRTLIFL